MIYLVTTNDYDYEFKTLEEATEAYNNIKLVNASDFKELAEIDSERMGFHYKMIKQEMNHYQVI